MVRQRRSAITYFQTLLNFRGFFITKKGQGRKDCYPCFSIPGTHPKDVCLIINKIAVMGYIYIFKRVSGTFILDASPWRESDILPHIFHLLSSQISILAVLLQDADGQSCDSHIKCLINDFSTQPTPRGFPCAPSWLPGLKLPGFTFISLLKDGMRTFFFSSFCDSIFGGGRLM